MRNRYGLSLALLLVAQPLLAQEKEPARSEPRTITVNAVGTVSRAPDRAVILVAVESRGATAQTATQANATKMEAVYAALRRAGIVPPNVSTTSYELQPEYSQPDPRSTGTFVPKVIGYVARNMVRVQVDSIARAGAIIDATVASGANRIDNLSFELRDTQSARMEALKNAVKQAQAMAQVIAEAAGQRLGLPLNINTSYEYPRPMYRAYAGVVAEAAPAPPPTPVEAGTMTVNATVNITYQILDH